MSEPAAPPPVLPHPPAPSDEWNEDLYQATTALLIEPEKPGNPKASFGCLAVSVLLFVLSFAWGNDWTSLALLVLVLFLHEAGHFLGMRLFGYRNVQMFFIPFFGAAVSGTKHAAPAWQQAVMLLLGPLPGIYLGLVWLLAWPPEAESWQEKAVLWLLVLNGFNLIPVVPLDGGRLVDVLVFARKPYLALAFRLFAVAALFWLAYFFSTWIFAVVGVLMVLTTPMRYRQARLERVFRGNPSGLPDELERLSEEQRRDLFGWTLLLNPLDRKPASLAGDMRTLHENMVARRPGLAVWLLLVGLYLSGFGATVGGVYLVRQHHQAAQQEQVAQP